MTERGGGPHFKAAAIRPATFERVEHLPDSARARRIIALPD